jgi:hypothetical protein
MIPVRVIGRDPETGKLYQAVRSEANSKRWGWIEIESPTMPDTTDTAGDIIFNFSVGVGSFPAGPPRANIMSGTPE